MPEIPDISSAFKPMGLACFGIKLGSKGCYATDFIRGAVYRMPERDQGRGHHGAGDSLWPG